MTSTMMGTVMKGGGDIYNDGYTRIYSLLYEKEESFTNRTKL